MSLHTDYNSIKTRLLLFVVLFPCVCIMLTLIRAARGVYDFRNFEEV
jgi:hypothetical protein